MDLKISQFTLLPSASPNAIIPIVQGGTNNIVSVSSLFVNNYDIRNTGTVVLSGPSITLGDESSKILVESGTISVQQGGITLYTSNENTFSDFSGISSIGVSNRQLSNTVATPLLDWSGTNIQLYNDYTGGGSYSANEAATNALVTILSAINSQTVVSRPYYDESLVILPTSSLSALSWSLPKVNTARVGQIKTFWTSQNITTLTVSVSGGGSFLGTPLTTANSNESYAFQCVRTSGNGVWLRLA
jgi:hypothetical protein